MGPIVHALFVTADQLDKVVDEMPQEVCRDQRVLLSGLARAFQLTADKLKAEEAEREARAMESAK